MVEINFPSLVGLFALGTAVTIIVLYVFFSKSEKKFTTVEINGVRVNAEVADNFVKKSAGLMNRESLGKNDGMLFVFASEDYHKFWMKNMMIPLDFIWISGNKTIVDITENVQPCISGCPNFTSQEKAQYVLEVNAGFAKENKIKVGEKVNFVIS